MEQSKTHHPVVTEDKTAGIQRIVFEFHPELEEQGKITDSDYKKADLLRRMRNDEDMHAYPLLMSLLLLLLTVSSLAAFWLSRSMTTIILGISGITGILLLRFRLKEETKKLILFKDDFERYVWEGLKLKNKRQIYIQTLYLLFFPFVLVLFAVSFGFVEISFQYWLEILLAYGLSSMIWTYVFLDDRNLIKQWKKELIALLPFNPEKPDF